MKGASNIPAILYVFVIALVIIAVIFLFFGVLGDKYDLTITSIWNVMKGQDPAMG